MMLKMRFYHQIFSLRIFCELEEVENVGSKAHNFQVHKH